MFGFLPIGLFYHAAYTLATSLLLWLLVRLIWPSHLEREARDRSDMIPAAVVFAYLAIVLYIGIFALRTRSTATPKISSWPAVRSGRRCSCCRCSAPT